MARLPQTTKWRDLSGGNIQSVSSDIAIKNGVPFSMNLLFEKVLGEAVSRPGTDIIGAQLASGKTTLGLFQHIDTTFSSSKLFAGLTDGKIWDVIAGSAGVTGLSTSAKMRFVTYLNTTLMLNGLTPRAYTSAGWVSTGGNLDIGNVPSGGQFPTEFKDRVYCAVNDIIYYTSAPTGSTVSWTGTGSGSLLVEREDGGGLVQALNKVPGYLMIYKQRSLKRWNFDSSFPDDLVNIGTQSAESVVRARGQNFFFYGPHGFYKTNGGYPTLISRPIQRIIDGIASSFYANVNGWSDNDNIFWSVGDVTVDFDRGYTETYSNVVIRYNIDTQQWATLQYNRSFRAMTQYLSGNDTLIAAGDTDGTIIKLNSGLTDYNGKPITYILQSPEFDFGYRLFKKSVSERIFVHSDGTTGAEIQRRLDYGEWKSFGNVKDIVTEVKLNEIFEAYVFEFRIVDSITGQAIKLRGLDFPNVDVHEA